MTQAKAVAALTFAGECALTALLAMAVAMACLGGFRPARELAAAPIAAGGGGDRGPQADLAVLTTFDPFHRGVVATEVGAVETEDAPETSLNLTLSFVRVTNEGGDSVAAIVGPGGVVDRYQIGDVVIPGVTLRGILVDRVLLERADGAVEALTLDDGTSLIRTTGTPVTAEQEAGAIASGDGAETDATGGEGVGGAADATVASQRIDAATLDPRALAASVQAAAVTLEDGRAGLRLSPQGDAAAFAAAGLEPGDVMLEVQGRRVRDEFDLLNLVAGLEEASTLSFLVHRSGQDVTITLDLTSPNAGAGR